MRRLVIDTNIYIDWFNAGHHEDILFQRDTVRHLSAVVLMELRAGAVAARDRRLVERVESAFARAGRILLPSRAVFVDAGDALRRLRARRGFRFETSHSIVNDVLIALSARSIGATVVTQNEVHYRAIQAVRLFQLVVVRSERPHGNGLRENLSQIRSKTGRRLRNERPAATVARSLAARGESR